MHRDADIDRRSSLPGEHLSDHQILDLVHGLLDQEVRARAVNHAAVCPACEVRLQEQAGWRERLRARHRLCTSPRGEIVIRSIPVSDEAPTGPRPSAADLWNRVRDWWRSAAGLRGDFGLGLATAAAVVVLLLAVPLQNSSVEEAPSWMPVPHGELRFRNGDGISADPNLQHGLEAYGRRDLRNAIYYLRRAQTAGGLETVRRIYLGSALYRVGDYESAIALLQTVDLETLPDPWGRVARLTLHAALRDAGRTAAADSMGTILSREPDQGAGARADPALIRISHRAEDLHGRRAIPPGG
ncbi:MAG: hypothetical protein GF355_14145 [Candidatus Eisenbacteria bacterium]|nr:hypothetical protein [Candidatus Eisenbacteria bacterium]